MKEEKDVRGHPEGLVKEEIEDGEEDSISNVCMDTGQGTVSLSLRTRKTLRLQQLIQIEVYLVVHSVRSVVGDGYRNSFGHRLFLGKGVDVHG